MKKIKMRANYGFQATSALTRRSLVSSTVETVEKLFFHVKSSHHAAVCRGRTAQHGQEVSMARYKPYDVHQDKFIPVSFRDQILPGSFEHALNEIVDQHIDLTLFASRYTNDETGRLAYDPAVLLKIVLYGYYKGLVSSRRLAAACERHVVFMALSADIRPHFTTIADFVAHMHQEVVSVFTDVLLYASELNLIGRDTFAIDGCKLPSNASKQWSGTLKELRGKQKKLEAAARKIVERHRAQDVQEKRSPVVAQEERKRATYQRKIERIKTFLKTAKPNLGPGGHERKSNITDPDSAKMSTNHGVTQGYNGIAVVDAKHQIVVTAEAHGEGQEAHLLAPMIERTRDQCRTADIAEDVFEKTKLTADAGYSSQESVAYTQDHHIDAYMTATTDAATPPSQTPIVIKNGPEKRNAAAPAETTTGSPPRTSTTTKNTGPVVVPPAISSIATATTSMSTVISG
jgi:transposase